MSDSFVYLLSFSVSGGRLSPSPGPVLRGLSYPPCVWLLGRPDPDKTLPSFLGHSSQFQQSPAGKVFRDSGLLLLLGA